jgi:hypothetical protein
MEAVLIRPACTAQLPQSRPCRAAPSTICLYRLPREPLQRSLVDQQQERNKVIKGGADIVGDSPAPAAMSRSLAVEWSLSIRVSMAPGYVWASMSEALVKEGKLDPQPSHRANARRRFADPMEIAAVVCSLLSAF